MNIWALGGFYQRLPVDPSLQIDQVGVGIRLYNRLGKAADLVGVGGVAIGDALEVLKRSGRSVQEQMRYMMITDLIFGQQSIADAGEEHHGHQEGNHESVASHCSI